MFRRGRRLDDGASEGDHSDAAARVREKLGGVKKEEPTAELVPEFPDLLDYLWGWFEDIIAGSESGMGPPIVTWQGLRAWSVMMETDPEPWECRALVRLGSLRASIATESIDGG